jgi:hypothetical protein
LLVACNQTTAEAPTTTSHITDQQAFAAARSAVLASLKDPDSAKFGTVFMRKTVSGGMGAVTLKLLGITVDERTDIVCATVNSINSFGGYVGQTVFAYRVAHKDIFVDEGPGQARYGSIWCVDSTQVTP